MLLSFSCVRWSFVLFSQGEISAIYMYIYFANIRNQSPDQQCFINISLNLYSLKIDTRLLAICYFFGIRDWHVERYREAVKDMLKTLKTVMKFLYAIHVNNNLLCSRTIIIHISHTSS